MVIGPIGLFIFNKTKSKAASAVTLVLVLLVILLLSSWVLSPPGTRLDSAPSDSLEQSPPLSLYWNESASSLVASRSETRNRPVYPYSVIPGGVQNKAELQAALRNDPMVAGHYADFRTQSTRVIRLASVRQAYVSYRFGDHIYWTSKKITLRAGETLLTDGTLLARTRCGNRISEAPRGPSSPSEPAAETFEHPVVPNLPELTPSKVPTAPLVPFDPSPVLLALNPPEQSGTPGGGPVVPFFPILPCCSGSTGPSPSPKSPLPPPLPLPQPGPKPEPPVVAPEPDSFLLLSVGITGLFCLWALRRS